MTALLELKQKIKGIYGQYEMYILPTSITLHVSMMRQLLAGKNQYQLMIHILQYCVTFHWLTTIS